MRRYLKISLLLILIEPLFMWNVYAKELDTNQSLESLNDEIIEIENEFNEVNNQKEEINNNQTKSNENDFQIEQVVSNIPDQFDVYYIEEDIFQFVEEDNLSVVELDVMNRVQEYLESMGVSLIDYGYSFEVRSLLLDDLGDLDQFIIYFYKDGSIVNQKVVTVQFNNTNDYNEEDEQFVNDLIGEEELNVDIYNDFYTSELVSEEESIDDFLDHLVSGTNVSVYFIENERTELELSTEINGISYFFLNHVFYQSVLTHISKAFMLSVIPEITDDDIVSEIRDMIKDSYQEELSAEDIIIEDENVYPNMNEVDALGFVAIHRLKSSQKIQYPIIEGANAIVEVDSNTSLSFRINVLNKKFIKLLINGVEVNPKYYTISENMIITLKSDFINALDKAQYRFEARFSDGVAKSTFTLKEKTRVVDSEPYDPYYPVYTYYEDYNNSQDNSQNLKTELKEASAKEVVKNYEDNSKVLEVLDDEENESNDTGNKEEKNGFNKSLIPIIIVICAFAFGTFGGFLYKKSLED